jgi:GntR family transcriptional regulator
VTDLIRSIGAEPGTLDLKVSLETASYRIAQNLNIELDDPVVCIERVRTADGRRVVYMNDILSQSLVTSHRPEIGIREIKDFLTENHSVYHFIRSELGIAIHHGTAKLRPVMATEQIAEKLEVEQGSGLLYFEQIDYGQNELPIIFSDEYHVAGAFTFTIYRS